MRYFPKSWQGRIALIVVSFVCIVLVLCYAYVSWIASRPNDAHGEFRACDTLPTIMINPDLALDDRRKIQIFELTKKLVSKRSSWRARPKRASYTVKFDNLDNTPNTFRMYIYLDGIVRFDELSPSGQEVSSSAYRAHKTRAAAEIVDLFHYLMEQSYRIKQGDGNA